MRFYWLPLLSGEELVSLEHPSWQLGTILTREQGLTVISLMKETAGYATPTAEDLNEWASGAGADHPVLADVGGDVAIRFIKEDPAAVNGNSISISYPNTQMIAHWHVGGINRRFSVWI